MTLGMAGDMDDQAMTANLHNFEVQLNAEDSRIQVLQAAQAEFGSSFAAISAVATPPAVFTSGPLERPRWHRWLPLG